MSYLFVPYNVLLSRFFKLSLPTFVAVAEKTRTLEIALKGEKEGKRKKRRGWDSNPRVQSTMD